MATLTRRPLASRPLPIQIPPTAISPFNTSARVVSAKRARSPDPVGDAGVIQATAKRARGIPPSPVNVTSREDRREKDRRKAERDAQKAEFRVKYTRAFPTWVFYFDLDVLDPESASTRDILVAQVTQLGARIDDFFSSEITHLITRTGPVEDVVADKENLSKPRPFVSKMASALRSPIKLRGRAEDKVPESSCDDLVKKAMAFNMKIWSVLKLESVLERCLVPAPATASRSVSATTTLMGGANSHQRPLTRLLQSERLHGTSERDPTQKRHDFRYFSRATCFVLVEDMQQELATIAALEYPVTKSRDGSLKGTWPVLHCHPHARGPFIAYDEKEKRRWERTQKAETAMEDEKAQKKIRMMRREEERRQEQARMHVKKTGDLRRSVSMNNLHRRASNPNTRFQGFVDLDAVDLDADNQDSANASGYLASTGTGGAYMAASGNSVGITSTTGTTSTAGISARSWQLPAALRGRIQQQVVTSRKFPAADKAQGSQRAGTMGPPTGIPGRPGMLRKSRSTNTLRLPKRQEGSKPGYCESCRAKFDNFKAHTQGRKHRKFAVDDANFLQLDYVLGRVRRRTIEEVELDNREREVRRGQRCSSIGFGEPEDDVDEAFHEGRPASPLGSTTQEDSPDWDGDVDIDSADEDMIRPEPVTTSSRPF